MMLKVTLRNLAAHKIRLALTALSVILGVAFVAGTLIFTDTMTKSFDEVFDSVGKNVAVDVKGKAAVGSGDNEADTPVPVPETFLTTLTGIPGVAKATGHVMGYTGIIGRDGKLTGGDGPPKFGVNWVEGGDDTLAEGVAPKAGEVAIDEQTVKKEKLALGQQVKLAVRGPVQTAKLVGVIEADNLMGATMTAFDTVTAQKLLLKPGQFTDVRIQAQSGTSEAVLLARVKQALPGNLEAISGEQMRDDAKGDVDQIMSIIRTFLLVFAGISIFVGGFIIFNTFGMLVAQRTRELALLRAVGASRKQITRAVLGEALGVGFLGSTLGLLAGLGLASLLQAFFRSQGADFKGGLALTPSPVIWAYVVGIGATVISAYFPARRAAKIPPVAAMRDDIALPQRSLRIRLVVGVIIAGLGAILMGLGLAGAGEQPLVTMGIGVVGVFLGVTMLAPALSKPVIRFLALPFPRLFGATGRMARENPQRNPRRTAATAAALMIGLSLVTTVNVLSSSLNASLVQVVDEQFGADYAAFSNNPGGIDDATLAAVAAAPNVERATPVYADSFNFGDSKDVSFQAGEVEGLVQGSNAKVLSGSPRLGPNEMMIDEDVAKKKDLKVGSTVPVQYGDGSRQTLKVTAIYAPNEFLGPRTISVADFKAHSAKATADGVVLETSKQDATTRAGIDNALKTSPGVTLQDPKDVKDEVKEQLNSFVLFITVLLALSIIIAVVGVINTLALSVIERTREIGLLRAVGTSRAQMWGMISLESVVIAVFGSLLGICLGVGFGTGIQQAAGDDIKILDIPFGTLVLYLVIAAVVGFLAALWPAFRAGRMDILKAIGD
ncbi:MAG: ABC transporter permease [Streptosporangiaceae bacterium]